MSVVTYKAIQSPGLKGDCFFFPFDFFEGSGKSILFLEVVPGEPFSSMGVAREVHSVKDVDERPACSVQYGSSSEDF